MEKPLISIIIPVYKVEKYLEKCIKSVLSQTYKNLQIILVDDGSPDNCGNICDDYARVDNRIEVIHKANGGLSDARNVGLKAARGEYIGFVDSDDYVESNYIEVLYYYYQKYNTVPICGFVYHDEYNHEKPVKYSWSGDEGLVSLGEAFRLKSELYLTALWNKLFDRRLIVEKNIRFDTNVSVGEDLRFSVDYFIKNNIDKICVLPEPLYHYMKLTDNSLMSSFVDDLDREKDSLNLIRNLAIKYNKNADAEYEKALEQVKTSMIYLIMRDKKFSNKEKFIRIKKINYKFTLIMFVKEKILIIKELLRR